MLYNYKVLNPVSDNNKPFLKGELLFFNVTNKHYRYYIETALVDEYMVTHYYLLLSPVKFDEHCRLCNVDSYGRCKLKPRGEMLNYIKDIIYNAGNPRVTFIESKDKYDLFEVD